MKKKREKKKDEQETPIHRRLQIAGLKPDMNFYLINVIDDNDNDDDGNRKEEEQEQEVLPSKKKQVGHKTKFPQNIITFMGEKGSYKQFRYLLYQRRTNKVQYITRLYSQSASQGLAERGPLCRHA